MPKESDNPNETHFLLTNEDGDDAEDAIYETVMTQPEKEIRKVTFDLHLADPPSSRINHKPTWTMIKAFIDEGASITACGSGVGDVLAPWQYTDCSTSITAGGMDSRKTGRYYRSNVLYTPRVRYMDFNSRTGKEVERYTTIKIWNLGKALPPNMLILGRNAKHILGLGTFARGDIKRLVYEVQQSGNYNTLPKDMEAALDRIEYRGTGNPGLYEVGEDMIVRPLKPKYVHKSELQQARERGGPSVVQLQQIEVRPKPGGGGGTFTTKRAGAHVMPQQMRRLDQAQESYVAGKDIIYVVDDECSDIDQAMLAKTSATLSNGRTVQYPAILDKITYGSMYSADDIIEHKLRLAPKASAFAATKWDIGHVHTDEPFTILIREEDRNRPKTLVRPRRFNLRPDDAQIMRAEVDEWCAQGIGALQQQHNPGHVVRMLSNAFVVHRIVGFTDEGRKVVKSRVVVDYVDLNKVTEPYLFNNLTIESMLTQLGYGESGKNEVFSSTDIRKWFYHIDLSVESRRYAAVAVPRGVFIPYRVSMGMTNAATFCHEIASKRFKGLALAIQDDLHIGSRGPPAALDDFVAVVDRAFEIGSRLCPIKSFVGMPQVEGVGKVMSAKGYAPLRKHRTKMLRMPYLRLRTKYDWQTLNGMAGYIERHVPGLRQQMDLLQDLMLMPATKPPKKAPCGREYSAKEMSRATILVRSDESKAVFANIMELLESSELLHWPDMRLTSHSRFLLIADTSLKAVGMALYQQKHGLPPFKLSSDNKEQTKQIFNDYNLVDLAVLKLKPLQQRYGATEREALGIYEAVLRFPRQLCLRQFDCVGDCRPLEAIFKIGGTTKNTKILRWKQGICEYPMRFVHRSGILLGVVDYLSRLATGTQARAMTDEEAHLEMFKQLQRAERAEVLADDDGKQDAVAGTSTSTAIHFLDIERDSETKPGIIDNRLRLHAIYAQDELGFEFDSVNGRVVNTETPFARAPTKEPEQEALDRIRTNYCIESGLRMEDYNELCTMHAILQQDEYVCSQLRCQGDAALVILQSDIFPRPRTSQDARCEDAVNCNESLGLADARPPLPPPPYASTSLPNHRLKPYFAHSDRKRPSTATVSPGCPSAPRAPAQERDECFAVMTRAQRLSAQAAKDDGSNEIQEHRRYRLRPENKHRIIDSNTDIIELFRECQDRVYRPIIQKLRNSDYHMGVATIWDEFYRNLIDSGKLTLDERNLIVYDLNRILVPPELRNSLMQYAHAEVLEHRRGRVTYAYLIKRYYWRRMNEDTEAFLQGCPCVATQKDGRKGHDAKKGTLRHILVVRPNEKVYVDMFGPLWNGKGVLVCVDAFDSYLTLQMIGLSAIDFVRAVLFGWCYKLGFIRTLVSDRGTNFVNGLVNLFAFVYGIKKAHTIQYSPWCNIAESQMAALAKGLRINKLAYESLNERCGLGPLFEGLAHLAEHPKRLKDPEAYLAALAWSHNSIKKRATGYSPNDLRFMTPAQSCFLDVALRFKDKRIDPQLYFDRELGIIDYERFYRSSREALRKMNKIAADSKMEHARREQARFNQERVQGLRVNDWVIIKEKDAVRDKTTPTRRYGWYVSRELPNRQIEIKNLLVPSLPPRIVHIAKVRRVHQSLWTNPEMYLRTSRQRMNGLANK